MSGLPLPADEALPPDWDERRADLHKRASLYYRGGQLRADFDQLSDVIERQARTIARLTRAYNDVEGDVLNRMGYWASRNGIDAWEAVRQHHRELWHKDKEDL